MKVDSRHPFRHSGEKPVPYPDTGPESRGEGQDRHIGGRVPRPIFIPLRGLLEAIGESGIVPH